ncbi:MAG: ATP-binding protein [Deltaproteobacteria bacterium]|nr:ATP-binding protein [Deltaproteobacteria bacterium]
MLTNAAKFTGAGGYARVMLERVDDHALVRVIDTGAGIAPDTLARVFEPFVQADETLDRSHGGLGLGLALVKALVEMHGGSVEAHSDGLGKGTEFRIRLPLSDHA